jgi:hypothetical protein
MAETNDQLEKTVLDLSISSDRISEPAAYAEAALQVANNMLAGKISALDAQRMRKELQDMCLEITGVTLAEASKETMDPIRKLTSILDSDERDLRTLQAAIKKIDDVRVAEGIKKKWLTLIDEVISLQEECRSDPAKAVVYFLPDQEDGSVLQLEPHHVWFFECWRDDSHQHSLIMAPPRHGKTTLLRGLAASEIGEDPRRRCLILKDSDDKARKEVLSLKQIIRSPRFQALYPGLIVQRRSGEMQSEDSSRRFTVTRPNWSSREPTIEAAGIRSNINGNSYDYIYADDISGIEARHHPNVRVSANENWVAVVENRLPNPDKARIRMICTPWHEEDTAGLIQKSVARGHMTNWRVEIDRFAILDDDAGKPIPIWPDRFGVDYLQDKKMRQGEIYDCTHRLRPRIQSQVIVRKCRYYPSVRTQYTTSNDEAIMEALATCERWLSIDPSGSGNRQSCLHGVVEFCFTPSNYLFCSDVWFHLMSAPALLEWLVTRITTSACDYAGVVIEAQGGIKGQVDMWHDQLSPSKLAMLGYNKPLIVRKPDTTFGGIQHRGKLVRHREAAPYVNSGIVRFAGQRVGKKSGQEGTYVTAVPNSSMARLCRIMETFDGTNNADAVDAFNQFVLINRNRIRNPFVSKRTTELKGKPKRDPMMEAFSRTLNAMKGQDTDEALAEEDAFYQGLTMRSCG